MAKLLENIVLEIMFTISMRDRLENIFKNRLYIFQISYFASIFVFFFVISTSIYLD